MIRNKKLIYVDIKPLENWMGGFTPTNKHALTPKIAGFRGLHLITPIGLLFDFCWRSLRLRLQHVGCVIA